MPLERPDYTPQCCGKDAEWVVQSVNIAYFYCKECKKEVKDVTPPALEWPDNWNSFYMDIQTIKKS